MQLIRVARMVLVMITAWSLLGRAALAAEARQEEVQAPDTVAGLKLLMTIDEAKAAKPSLQIDDTIFANTNPPPPFSFAIAKLGKQPFGDLQGCDVTANFYQKKLIYFSILCPEKTAAAAYLVKTYGEPGSKRGEAWQWTGRQRSMTYAPQSGAIAVTDNFGTNSYQLQMMSYLPNFQAAQQGAAAGAAQAPVAK